MLHKNPALAADAVVFDRHGRLLLIRRKNPPFKGRYALPGGFVEYGESAERAVLRELHEETGLKVKSPRLIGVYSNPRRDPRGHVVSIAYLVLVGTPEPKGGSDAISAEFVDNWRGKKLAFDHAQIVADALRIIEQA